MAKIKKERPKKSKKPETKLKEKPRGSFYDYYVATIPLLKSLSWPIIAIVIITIFWGSLKPVIESIPNLVERSSRMTVGEFAVELENAIRNKTPQDLRSVLTGLSSDAVLVLIRDGNYQNYYEGYWCETTKEEIYEFKPGIDELEQRGLIEFVQKEKPNCPKEWFWSWTELGEEAFIFTKSILIEEFLEAWEYSK